MLALNSLQQLIFFSVLHLVWATELPVLAPDLILGFTNWD
jgi:hypothetical protein